MPDRTKEDILQDAEIVQEQAKIELARRTEVDLATRLFKLEARVSELEALRPLMGLLEFVESIKAHFANFRLK